MSLIRCDWIPACAGMTKFNILMTSTFQAMSLDSALVTLENEHEIVEQAKTDDGAFEVLYNFYFPKLYGYVIKRVGHREVAEDIVSGVFIKVFTKLNTYQKRECPFAAWIYRITTNALIDHYRKAGRNVEVTVEEFPDVADNGQNPEMNVALLEDQRRVRAVLEELPAKYQEIIQLKFFADLSNTEIAETMGISANNAGVLLYRALQKFEKVYQKSPL